MPEAPSAGTGLQRRPRTGAGSARATELRVSRLNSITTRKCEQKGLRFCHGKALPSCALRPEGWKGTRFSLGAGAAPRVSPSTAEQRRGGSVPETRRGTAVFRSDKSLRLFSTFSSAWTLSWRNREEHRRRFTGRGRETGIFARLF